MEKNIEFAATLEDYALSTGCDDLHTSFLDEDEQLKEDTIQFLINTTGFTSRKRDTRALRMVWRTACLKWRDFMIDYEALRETLRDECFAAHFGGGIHIVR